MFKHKTDQLHKKIVVRQLRRMLSVPRPSGCETQPCAKPEVSDELFGIVESKVAMAFAEAVIGVAWRIPSKSVTNAAYAGTTPCQKQPMAC